MIYLYIELFLFALLLVCAPFMLWADYLAVMNCKRVRDAGKVGGPGLSRLAAILGGYVYLRGVVLDLLCNVFHMSIILLEWPRELTVTRRIRRHVETGTGWRQSFCLQFRVLLLDHFDITRPDGIHR